VNYNDPVLGWDSLGTRPLSHAQVIALIGDRVPAFKAGTSWSYSNSAFYLIGMIVERLCGRSYGDYVHDVVGAPFGAPSMRAVPTVDIGSRARGYRLSGDHLVRAEEEDWSNPFAAGGLAATAQDLALWESRQSKGTAYAAMAAPTKLDDGMNIDYGLGTRLGRFEEHRVAGHTGNGNGFNNVVFNYRDDDLVIVVLTNSESHLGARPIAAGIARYVLRLPAATAHVVDLPVPSSVAAADSGEWIGDNGAVRVFAMGDHLRWRRPGEQGGGRSLPYEGDASFRVGPGILVRFDSIDGHARWAQVYIEGMFDEAQHRLR
jgi:CubicO group peptidase (beta-lactamase class C family)